MWQRRDPVESNMVCAYCNTSFYRPESKRVNSKSGLYFCCREHKDLAQRIGGFPEIQPPHYGSENPVRYRDGLRRRGLITHCQHCGYDKYPQILEVNHIDCDRSNNSPENLEVLCPTCHMEFHFSTNTGPWKRQARTSDHRESNPDDDLGKVTSCR